MPYLMKSVNAQEIALRGREGIHYFLIMKKGFSILIMFLSLFRFYYCIFFGICGFESNLKMRSLRGEIHLVFYLRNLDILWVLSSGTMTKM